MGLSWVKLSDLTITDQRSLAHVAIYGELERWMRGRDLRFGVLEGARTDGALLLNLAFWRPGDVAEVLQDDVITADQVAHNAWHALAADALGDAARSAKGLLLAEAIASAFDIYLVGRLMGHAPESDFLASQVPAMADAALDAGLEEDAFEALLERATREPERCFEELRQLLYDASLALFACEGVEDAAVALAQVADHPWAALLHHYELSTWVLFARCYATGDGQPAEAIDASLREAPDAMAWLEANWLAAT